MSYHFLLSIVDKSNLFDRNATNRKIQPGRLDRSLIIQNVSERFELIIERYSCIMLRESKRMERWVELIQFSASHEVENTWQRRRLLFKIIVMWDERETRVRINCRFFKCTYLQIHTQTHHSTQNTRRDLHTYIKIHTDANADINVK